MLVHYELKIRLFFATNYPTIQVLILLSVLIDLVLGFYKPNYVSISYRAERYRTEREELKAALARAEAAAAEAQQRLLQREQQQASSLPPRMALEAAAGISAEKRTTVNGRDGRTRKAASPNGLFRFPAAGSAAANGASGLRSPDGSLTGIVTSGPASRNGGGSNHSLPTASDFSGMEVVNNVFDPRTPAALRRTGIQTGSPGVMNKVSGWLTSL